MNEDLTTLNQLLDFHLKRFAIKLGLLAEDRMEFPTTEAVRLLNYAAKLAKLEDDLSKTKCLLISGLLLEHKKNEWSAIDSFVTELLIQIGLTPSAKMIGWDSGLEKFKGSGNLLTEISLAGDIINNEIIFRGKKIMLSQFQKRFWNAIDNNQIIGVSAPTSSGKSFVLTHKIIDSLSNGGHAIFVVPTLSLITQVTSDLRKLFRLFKIEDIFIAQFIQESQDFDSKLIFVLTQERLLSALLNIATLKEKLRLKTVIIDEIQNIDQIGETDDERAKILFNVIQDLQEYEVDKFIFAGPFLSSLDEALRKWFKRTESITTITDELPPVLNFTYSFRKSKSRSKLQIIQSNSFVGKQTIEIDDRFNLNKVVFEKSRYDGADGTHAFLNQILSKLNADEGSLVFSKSSTQATNTAKVLAQLNNRDNYGEEVLELTKYIFDTVHPKYELIETVLKNVAYHHGKVPLHIRYAIERAFQLKLLKTIVCTSTLMQGINLPAKYLIIRNPDFATKHLSHYEYSNLKGRAGRLMKDLIGTTIIIDDASFEEKGIAVAQIEKKALTNNYESRFNEYKDSIIESLSSANGKKSPAHDLAIYIKQQFLKHGENAMSTLGNVGITINDSLMDSILSQLSKIVAPKEICFKNPFWDPLDIDRLFNLKEQFHEIPKSPFEMNFRNTLISSLTRMDRDFSYYSRKYLGSVNNKMLVRIALTAEKWAQGESLRKVIEPSSWPIDSSNDVDERIETIQTKVVYGIGKLLRPLIQVQNEANPILSFIEIGSSNQRAIALMKLGLPRETAINLVNAIKVNFIDESSRVGYQELNNFIYSALAEPKINHWDKIILLDLLSQ